MVLVACAGAARAEAPLPDGGQPARLAWVDPARCLKACAAAPAGTMRRLDATGSFSPRGKHLVEATAA